MDEQIDQMLSFWHRQRRGDKLPVKQYLDLNEIKQDLQNISLHERLAPDRFIYRVHGTGIASTAPRDHTGENIIDIAPEVWRPRLVLLMNSILDQPCAIREEHLLEDPVRGVISRVGLHLPVADLDDGARFLLSYYPPGHETDVLPLSNAREPNTIRRAIGYTDINYIDIGAGIPDFAEQAAQAVRALTDKLLADPESL